jgi:2-polyprenyl-3-methyl-5-hydroxy-6-metoxy-1,4-benzoquinol methylase
MTSISFETVPCDLCDGSEFAEELTGIDWEFDGRARYKVSKCRQCSLIQQNPRPDKNSVRYIYPDSYGFYDERKATNPVNRAARSAIQRLKAKPLSFSYLDAVEKGTILDVGCGTGSTLYPYGFSGSLMHLASKGWRAYGCEISEEAARAGVKSGLEIQTGRLTELNYENSYFDVVRFNHVLEHSISPLDDLTKAKQILKPDGLLILSVPNIDSAAYHLFGRCWSGLDLPRHFYFFSPETLGKYFNLLGFEIVSDCTDSTAEDFSHSLKHFLHSGLFNKDNLECAKSNKLHELFNGRAKVGLLLLSLLPIINYFNARRLGDNYTVICKKRKV